MLDQTFGHKVEMPQDCAAEWAQKNWVECARPGNLRFGLETSVLAFVLSARQTEHFSICIVDAGIRYFGIHCLAFLGLNKSRWDSFLGQNFAQNSVLGLVAAQFWALRRHNDMHSWYWFVWKSAQKEHDGHCEFPCKNRPWRVKEMNSVWNSVLKTSLNGTCWVPETRANESQNIQFQR